jgi:APA family basic amino acid/polyamine antiporter
MSTNISFGSQLRRIKPAETIAAEGEHGGLKRSMGLLALMLFSVGSIVGTGIFVILGEAVPKAGPAVLVAFILAAITCAFSALSYAELAGSIPVSGSSYSYTYATLGEAIAWVTGWCLMLEYGVSVAAVAVGWGQYLNEFLATFGVQIPTEFAAPPGEQALVSGWEENPACAAGADASVDLSTLPAECVATGVFNIPAVFVVVACMFLLLRGISESATVNTIMVFIKIGILLFFCAIAFTAFEPGNFQPFVPLGIAGISAAAGQVFFSYIGFDAASTAGEEAKNPKRDLPRAIIGSLIIVTLLYVLVAAAAIGAKPWEEFEGAGGEAVLSQIARDVTGSDWAPTIISLGAVVSIFSVVLVVMYGQTRILFAMGRDGLLPKVFTKVNPRTQTPVNNTIIVTVIISILAAFVPLGQLAEATSIGTLAAFAIVNMGVIALWRARPELERTFKVPLLPLFPVLGVLFCLYLISSLAFITWVVFFLWLAVGMAIYLLYGRRHSNAPPEPPEDIPADVAAKYLPTRSLRPGTLLGVGLMVVIAVVSVSQLLSSERDTADIIWWGSTLIAALVGGYIAWRGISEETKARAMIEGHSDVGSVVTEMRTALWTTTIALVIPGILLVLAVRFAG